MRRPTTTSAPPATGAPYDGGRSCIDEELYARRDVATHWSEPPVFLSSAKMDRWVTARAGCADDAGRARGGSYIALELCLQRLYGARDLGAMTPVVLLPIERALYADIVMKFTGAPAAIA